MHNRILTLVAPMLLGLAACAADKAGEPGVATASDPQVVSPAPAEPMPAPTMPENSPTAPPPTAPASDVIAGWYMEHGTMGMFQRCGEDKQMGVDSEALRAEAKKFGLQANTPVYVRVAGTSDGSRVTVTKVEQFGSPTPVRDCAMTGVVMPAG